MGGELLAGVKNWVEWIGVQKGRESVQELAKTGGEDVSWGRTSRVVYRPSFISMTNKAWRDREWRSKGNRIDYVRGERKEVVLRHLVPNEEIGKMLRAKGKDVEEDVEEAERRWSFGKGSSVEAEFAFSKAVGAYSRVAVKEGSFKGRPIGNVKDQLAQRASLEEKNRGKKYIVTIGGSQMGRVADKIKEVGGDVVGVFQSIKVNGELSREKVEKVKSELMECDQIASLLGGQLTA